MNPWKVSTLGLTVVCAFVLGRDAFHAAHAETAANGGGSGSPIAFDWGVEQPHMEAALRDLRAARHSLEVAAEHKGGWRVLALKHTDEAITETVKGIDYAKGHPHE